jgi:hypothetical protein
MGDEKSPEKGSTERLTKVKKNERQNKSRLQKNQKGEKKHLDRGRAPEINLVRGISGNTYPQVARKD